MDLDYVANTPMREDWRLVVGFVLTIMGAGFFMLWRGHKPWISAAGLAAISVGLGFLSWAAL
jgi:hypothetical protein